MKYIFQGNLRGFYCGDCSDPLNNVLVKVYANRQDNAALLTAYDEKETFHVREAATLDGLSDALLASAQTDENGNFRLELDEKNYQGGPIDLDFECGSVPVRLPIPPPEPPKIFQFHITTIQPKWYTKDQQAYFCAEYQYVLPARWLCDLYCLFDVWVVCGQVTDCATKTPLEGLKVTAFDRDWLEDDELGSAYTDASGHFRIAYTGATLRHTPLSPIFNSEYPAGPDYYFRITSSSGNILLQEDRSAGCSRARANAGTCFCVELCVDGSIIVSETPWFTQIGHFNITTDIDGGGKTRFSRSGVADTGFGFFGGIKLKGFAPEKFPTTTNALYYRFRYSLTGLPSDWQNITKNHLAGSELIIGQRVISWNGVTMFQDIVIDHSVPVPSIADAIPAYDGSPAPPRHILHLDNDGWVRVDQNSIGSGFHGALLWLNTGAIPTLQYGDANTGETVGTPIAAPKHGSMLYVQFETTDDPTNAARTRTQVQTAQIYVNNWSEVNLLRLEELHSGSAGCTPVTNHATVKYSADHELMAAWSLNISSSALPGGVTGLPAGNTPRGQAATIDLATFPGIAPAFNTWPSCAYSITLTTRRMLTTGESDDQGKTNQVIFCK